MNIFPRNTNEWVKKTGYFLIIFVVIYFVVEADTIFRGLIDSVFPALFLWVIFLVIASFTKKSNTKNEKSSRNQIDQELLNNENKERKKDTPWVLFEVIVKIFAFGILIIIVLSGLAFLFDDSESQENINSKNQNMDSTLNCPDKLINSYFPEEIISEFANNPFRAKNNFEQSCIILTSKVNEIDDDGYVAFKTDVEDVEIIASCKDFDKEDLLLLNVEDTISFVGIFNEFYERNLLGSSFGFSLTNCKLNKNTQ